MRMWKGPGSDGADGNPEARVLPPFRTRYLFSQVPGGVSPGYLGPRGQLKTPAGSTIKRFETLSLQELVALKQERLLTEACWDADRLAPEGKRPESPGAFTQKGFMSALLFQF